VLWLYTLLCSVPRARQSVTAGPANHITFHQTNRKNRSETNTYNIGLRLLNAIQLFSNDPLIWIATNIKRSKEIFIEKPVRWYILLSKVLPNSMLLPYAWCAPGRKSSTPIVSRQSFRTRRRISASRPRLQQPRRRLPWQARKLLAVHSLWLGNGSSIFFLMPDITRHRHNFARQN
jgi:hypothetical protein